MAVYFALSGKHIKIGKSKNPYKRMGSIQTGNPRDCTLLCVIPGDWEMEKELHRKFSHLRDRGEWFIASQEIFSFTELMNDAFIGYKNHIHAKPIKKQTEKTKKKRKSHIVLEQQKEKIIEMHENGCSQRKIEREVFSYNGGLAWELVRDVLSDIESAVDSE